jgi:hypothetical protein
MATITNGTFNAPVGNGDTISGGTFALPITGEGTIGGNVVYLFAKASDVRLGATNHGIEGTMTCPTPEEIWNLSGVVDGKTPKDALGIMAAVLAGKVSGVGTDTETFTAIDGQTTRVVVTLDSAGNRTDVQHPMGPFAELNLTYTPGPGGPEIYLGQQIVFNITHKLLPTEEAQNIEITCVDPNGNHHTIGYLASSPSEERTSSICWTPDVTGSYQLFLDVISFMCVNVLEPTNPYPTPPEPA